MLHIDSRERKVIPFFNDSRVKVINNMAQGDYVILDNEDLILHVFERKTMKDFVQSMCNGTLHIDKMLELRLKTSCSLSFIIEHKTLFYEDDTMVYNVKYSKIRTMMNHILIEYKINLIYTKDQNDTAKRLIELLNVYGKLSVKGKGGSNLLTTKTEIPTEDYVKRMWKSIPGIGDLASSCLLKSYTFKELFELDEDLFKSIKINNKKLSKRAIDGLVMFRSFDKSVWIGILKEVNGVSKDKATSIMSCVTFFDELLTLSKMAIDGKKMKVIGSRIASYLTFKILDHPQNQSL